MEDLTGSFIPDTAGSRFVYEISNIDPIPGVTRIKPESELGAYSLVLLAHVTEHVIHPLNLARRLRAYVEPGGHLYLETPQEISDPQHAELQQSVLPADVGIHEHINFYWVPALAALLEAAGFVMVAIETAAVDLGWARELIFAGLGTSRSPTSRARHRNLISSR